MKNLTKCQRNFSEILRITIGHVRLIRQKKLLISILKSPINFRKNISEYMFYYPVPTKLETSLILLILKIK